METPEALQQRVRREPQMIARLRLAMTRLADAERERLWAMVAAKEAGLSIRQIAHATGLSAPLLHRPRQRVQLLTWLPGSANGHRRSAVYEEV